MFAVDLSGKTAVVTGGGQGLGAATASMLAQAGANVVVNYFDDAEGVREIIATHDAEDRALRVDRVSRFAFPIGFVLVLVVSFLI